MRERMGSVDRVRRIVKLAAFAVLVAAIVEQLRLPDDWKIFLLLLAGCSKWPSSEAAVSEKATRTRFGTLSFGAMREQSWRTFSTSC